MNLSNVNNIAFKIVGGLICAFLVLGGLGMLDHGRYVKCGIGIVSAVIIGILITRRVSVRSWIQMIVLLLVTMMIIGFLK